mmetsp:Transcript_6670/g.3759  ORF Transcript_6670/g.3759 Transcript_6670/m.3759 type:complete len:129 (+) Transcript_6670:17-403(+)
MTLVYTNEFRNYFTGGEIDGRFSGRVDLEKYSDSLLRLKNALVIAQGGIKRRAGLRHESTFIGDYGYARTGDFRLFSYVYGSQTLLFVILFKREAFYIDTTSNILRVEQQPGMKLYLILPDNATRPQT